MNAVINRIINMAERVGPNLRTPGAKLVLAQEITAAIPAHCNESVSVTRTTTALVWRMKIMCKGLRISVGTNCYRPVSGQSAVRQPRSGSSSKGGSVYSSQRLNSRVQRRHSVGPMTGTTMGSLRDPLRYFLPLAFGSAAISSCSLVFCQLESGLYSFRPLARTSVFLPRSF
jgi:hypothetical protein